MGIAMTTATDALRIDRWLFFCRFYKTRVRAAEAVAGGHVKINGQRAAPGTRVSRGDAVYLLRDRIPYRFTVTAIPQRRGPAAEARACYEEDPAALRERRALQDGLRADRLSMPRTKGRPDKHTRRKLRGRNRGENQ